MKMKKITFRRLISILLLAAGAVSLFFGIRSFGGKRVSANPTMPDRALCWFGRWSATDRVLQAAREQDGPWALPGQQVEYIVTNAMWSRRPMPFRSRAARTPVRYR